MKKAQTNKWTIALMIILTLMILSFFISIFISLIIGEDFESFDGNVAVIEITGPIISKDGNFLFDDATSADEIRKLIRKADKNNKIKAIVFEINSPGGSAVASDEIAREIKKVNKTTVAWIREVGASGGYWIASSTDHVIANRMSITGSIGVIASYLGFSGFLEEHNVTYERLVSGKYKDLGIPFKEMTPQERILFQKSLDKIHDYFVDEVAANRNLKKSDVKKIATGQFYLGVEALDLGLVDELGSRDEVIAYVERNIGEEVDLVKYKKEKGFLAALSQAMNEKSYHVGLGLGSSFFAEAEAPKTISIIT
tara:strand:- start:2100 stop:3032 length:933 start_codon:yes stop_codon:yes gene_type:complete